MQLDSRQRTLPQSAIPSNSERRNAARRVRQARSSRQSLDLSLKFCLKVRRPNAPEVAVPVLLVTNDQFDFLIAGIMEPPTSGSTPARVVPT